MPSIKFDFTNADGDALSGRLELPAKPVAFAIFAHCFTCSKNILAATRISKSLAELGIGVLRFDFTGLGNSEGDFSNTNFSSNVQDILAAYEELSKQFETPSILIGHSLGGSAVLKAQEKLDGIKAVVTIAAPSDTHHVTHLFENDIEEINDKGEANVQLAGIPFKIKKQFIEDIREQNLLDELGKSRKAFLIMHSPVDETVSIGHAANIYKALKHPKSYISLDKADHLVTDPDDAEYIATMIRGWLSRYLPERGQEDLGEEGFIRVKNRPGHNYTHDIYSKDHHIVGDEPKHVKGDHLGMNPYELLLSALGACTAMTMKMYCLRKGYAVTNVDVQLSHAKHHLEDCETCDGEKKLLDVITKKIKIEGDFTPEQKERVYEIAERCPVNRTLKSEIIIKSEHL